MTEWKEIAFSKVLEDESISYGIVQPGPHVKKEGIPIVRVQNIKNGKIIPDDIKKVHKDIESSYLRTRLKGGELLITLVGSIGECAFATNDYIGWNVARAVGVARIKNTFSKEFIRYCFATEELKYQLYGNTNDTVQPTLNLKELKSLKLLIPEIEEQRAIASVLSSLDDKIDLLHRQNRTLEEMAETLFRQWFVVEASEEWEWHKLGEFVEAMRGLSYKGAGLANKENGIPMHNLNSVFEGGGYKYEGIKYYSGDYKERHLTQPGDIIITNTEQGHEMLLIGYPAIVPKFYGEIGIFSQHIYKLKLTNDKLTKPYLYYLLMTNDVREQITGATNGSTVNMLSKDGIEWAKFRFPPKSLIRKFTEFVIPIHEKEEENQTQIRTLEKLRDTLLPKLMSGEVRIKT